MEARVSSLMNLARLHPSRARVPWASPTPCVRPRCQTPVTLDPVRTEARAPCQHWTPTSARVHVAGPGPRVQKLITVPISRVEMELSAFLMETTTNASVNQDSRVQVVKLTSMNVSSWPTPVFMEDAKTRMEDTGKITISNVSLHDNHYCLLWCSKFQEETEACISRIFKNLEERNLCKNGSVIKAQHIKDAAKN